eukprot:s326_g41.t1
MVQEPRLDQSDFKFAQIYLLKPQPMPGTAQPEEGPLKASWWYMSTIFCGLEDRRLRPSGQDGRDLQALQFGKAAEKLFSLLWARGTKRRQRTIGRQGEAYFHGCIGSEEEL